MWRAGNCTQYNSIFPCGKARRSMVSGILLHIPCTSHFSLYRLFTVETAQFPFRRTLVQCPTCYRVFVHLLVLTAAFILSVVSVPSLVTIGSCFFRSTSAPPPPKVARRRRSRRQCRGSTFRSSNRGRSTPSRRRCRSHLRRRRPPPPPRRRSSFRPTEERDWLAIHKMLWLKKYSSTS